MKKISHIFFSMQTMGTLMLIFAFAIGTATFIENDFGANGAKAVVYNALWFNILLILLAINLTGRIILDKLYMPKKFTIFLFHFSFLIILIGAGITRFISYEGVMHIREGNISNSMLTDNTFIELTAAKDSDVKNKEKSVLMSSLTPQAYSESLKIDNKKFKFSSIQYVPNAREIIVESDGEGNPYIIFVYSNGDGRSNFSAKYGEVVDVGNIRVNFSDTYAPGIINIKIDNGELVIYSEDNIIRLSMLTSVSDTLEYGQWHPFKDRMLHSIGENRIVLTDFYENGAVDYIPFTGKGSMMDAMIVEVTSENKRKNIVLRGGKGYKGTENYFFFDGVNFKMTYGAKEIILPFAIKLEDFQLERYPGSNSPSSYASEVIVYDNVTNESFDYRIYMNNVLNYNGYRFFQSSYDTDELGTILSVNHDYWGTFFSYVGYFLLSLGMLLSLFYKNTRFSALGRQIKNQFINGSNIKIILLLIALGTTNLNNAQGYTPISALPSISPEQADEFGNLMVQSQDGRLKPINTLSSEILRKVSRKNSLGMLNSDQVMLGMLSSPMDWQNVKMIKIGHPEVIELLGVDGKLASYLDFINLSEGTYKLGKYVTTAYEKKPGQRSKFDNEIIKVDERLNICYMVYSGDILRILPDPTSVDIMWYSPISNIGPMSQEDSVFVVSVIPTLLISVADGDVSLADQLIQGIGDYQQRYAGSILPSKTKIDYEIIYNKIEIFNNLSRFYGLIGVLMIILLFV
ncbi:MAG: cytochrome c biogenesis protein ResB, partial [Bacteroidales bacterium]|nr:cytochrome c biogenesis protein ResB [Bacteroidales bacterium]